MHERGVEFYCEFQQLLANALIIIVVKSLSLAR